MADMRTGEMLDALPAIEAWGVALTDALRELSTVSAFFKDRERRFVWCSEALTRLVGAGAEQDVIGLRDEDFAPADLAADYRRHEEAVLRDGRRLSGVIELVRPTEGAPIWYLSTKTPVRAADGQIIGLAGVTSPLARRQGVVSRNDPMLRAAAYISANLHRRVTVDDLAHTVAMSRSQFTRRFKERFNETPHQYVRRFRVAAASDLLVTTDRPLAAIASATGYADQSHFSNDFARFRSMTPTSYRRAFAQQ